MDRFPNCPTVNVFFESVWLAKDVVEGGLTRYPGYRRIAMASGKAGEIHFNGVVEGSSGRIRLENGETE